MTREEYHNSLLSLQKRQPDLATPEGQKFHIGEIVKIVNPCSWFSKISFDTDRERLYEIEYSYKQKFGGEDVRSYSLRHLFEDNSSAWYHERELELVVSIEAMSRYDKNTSV